MKKSLIFLAIFVILAGGAAAAWFVYLRALFEDPAGEATAEAAGPPQFVKVENLVMPVIYGDQVTYHITLSITLQVIDEDTVIEIKRSYARLQDVVVTELHALYARRFVQDDGLTGPVVQRRLLQVTRAMFGADRVRSLLIREVDRRVPSPVT